MRYGIYDNHDDVINIAQRMRSVSVVRADLLFVGTAVEMSDVLNYDYSTVILLCVIILYILLIAAFFLSHCRSSDRRDLYLVHCVLPPLCAAWIEPERADR